MSSFSSTILSLLVGIVATVWASWYYFRKSQDKRLAIDVQFSTSILRGIDPQVRRDLQVSHRGKAIEDMVHLQFLVLNQGQRAIRDLIEPLSVRLPSTATVLDASIVHVQQEGRKVDIEAATEPDHCLPIFGRRRGFSATFMEEYESRTQRETGAIAWCNSIRTTDDARVT